MTSRVVMFSGGLASWAAAGRVIEQHGPAGVTLLFTDTRTEDADLYRFLDQVEPQMGVPLVRLADGRTIWEVFHDERFLGNARADPCSRILKRELARRWLDEHAPGATLVMGYDWTEIHRHERAVRAWAPRPVESPLCDPPYRSRADWMSDLRAAGIEPPRLYSLGFEHNNCGGGCVKAGISHFTRLYAQLPDVYADWEAHEAALRAELGDVSIMVDRTGGTRRNLTLADLRARIEAGASLPLWEVGGCACFEEPEP